MYGSFKSSFMLVMGTDRLFPSYTPPSRFFPPRAEPFSASRSSTSA